MEEIITSDKLLLKPTEIMMGSFDDSDSTEIMRGNKLRYKGSIKDSKYHGVGQLYSSRGSLIYKGHFENGKFNGEGIQYYNNKIEYIGTFRDNKKSGLGIWFNKKEFIKCIGMFENNKPKYLYRRRSFTDNLDIITQKIDSESGFIAFVDKNKSSFSSARGLFFGIIETESGLPKIGVYSNLEKYIDIDIHNPKTLQEDCAICFTREHNKTILSCGHVFCTGCTYKFNNCPMCRE